MPDLAEPGRNAYRGDVQGMGALALVRRSGANWHCYANDSIIGLNQNGQLWECSAQSVEVRSGRRCFQRGAMR